MNVGKQFEKDIKDSCKTQGIFLLRLKDAGGWSNANNTRFTPNNLCDFIMHFDKYTILIELKTHLQKSIPQTVLKQVDKMAEINHPGVLEFFILNYRKVNETYLITAKDIMRCLKNRKSVDLQFCRNNGVLIPQRLKRVHYFFDIREALEKLETNFK